LGQVRTERALEIVLEQEDRITEVECLRVLALIARKRDALEHAEKHARSALALATELQHAWITAKAAEELGRVFEAKDDSDAATETFDTAARAYMQTGAEGRAAAIRARQAGQLNE
jgi:hypothetical protein